MTKSWSASLEHGEYEDDRELVIKHAIEAVEETQSGTYVNLVTPHNFGNPEQYLTSILNEKFHDILDMKYIDQCGCGGHVLRIYK
ncbi:CGCGG family rSAM-modified RiPP protein [Evansella sp. AB-rgal1]|uniref:CGCGG family putative rSAM-modified RiPP protein n=1 Tax=Evansella sp. AB-rgal1 TaxID=3242696 RepID=UPI00359EB2E1